MDAVRYRPRPLRGRLRLTDRPDAGRSAGRRRALGTSRRRPRRRGDLRQRLGLRGHADLSVVLSAAVLHSLASCVLGPGDRRDQPRPGRARRDRRATGTQRALRLRRQRARGGRHGRLRIFSFRPRRLLRHRPAARPGAPRAARDRAEARSIPSVPTARRRDGAAKSPVQARAS